MPIPSYTEEEITYALKCYARGDKVEKIEEATGIRQKIIYTQASRRGIKRNQKKYQTYTLEEKQEVMRLFQVMSAKEVEKKTGVPVEKIRRWSSQVAKITLNLEPETLTHQIAKVKAYLLKKHKSLRLTNKQAFDEIGTFERGKDLGKAIGSGLLPSTGVTDVARYIVLHT